MHADTSRVVVLSGATGLTGSFLLPRLLAEPTVRQMRALVRRPLPIRDDAIEPCRVDFEQLEEHAEVFDSVDDVYCCLGTTIKKAGSPEAFRRVDLDMVASLARLAREHGARRFVMISSVGADPASSNLYLRTKGEAEAAVAACGYPEVHILRPGILTGPRQEVRPAERIGIALGRLFAPVMVGGLRRYRPIAADTVAAAMVGAARRAVAGHHVYTNVEIRRLAD